MVLSLRTNGKIPSGVLLNNETQMNKVLGMLTTCCDRAVQESVAILLSTLLSACTSTLHG